MLKTKQKGSTRRGQRLHPGPFSLNQPSRAKAQVQLNRLGQQLKKKLKHGTPMDVVDSVTSEIGWVGLVILFLCVVSVCYVIITVMYSGNANQTANVLERHHKVHPDHIIDASPHLDDVDPEHWPHHSSMDSSKEERHTPKQPDRKDAQRDSKERTRGTRRGGRGRRDEQRARRDRREAQRDRDQPPKRDTQEEQPKEVQRETGDNAKETLMKEDDEATLSNWDSIWNTISTVNMNSNTSINPDALHERAYAIKSAFLHAWHGYAKHALGHDEIRPVSDLPGDSWGGLGATLIDSLDTLMIMQIKDEFKQAREQLQQVKFDIDLQVSFFETTIRHLGGLIGAYEMSKLLEPEDKFMLQQAISLGDHLLAAFNTKHGIPKSMVNLQSGEIKNYGWTKDRSVLSEVGSNQLEFYAMSEYTDDGKYYAASSKVYTLLDEAQTQAQYELYPRLIETDSATFAKNEKVYSLGGMSDSFYEYTLKLWILTNYNDKLAIKMYVESINAANEKLLRMVHDKRRRQAPYYFYGEEWYGKFRGKMEELQCFMPGVLALGSYHAMLRDEQRDVKPLSKYEEALINDKEKHLKLAHVLLESCVALYTEMPTGLAAESIEFNQDSWDPKEMKYQLRPETLESLFIMWSLTGNDEYREWAWNIFESIQKHCKTDVAYSGIEDVTVIPAKQDNQMQSYVMAETFKYLFLLFDDYAAKLLPLDKFVFNTEAHPIRIISDITKYKWYNADGDGETETVAV
eukprot:201927_1